MINETLRHPELSALLRWWQTHHGDGELPAAADLAPDMLRRWLDNLIVMELPAGGQARYAYYGANLAAAFGLDMVGRSIDQLPAEQARILAAEFENARAARQPIARRYTADFGGTMQTWERLLLPFADADGAVEKILVAVYRLD